VPLVFEHPWWFLLAPAALPLVWLGTSWMRAVSPVRRRLAAIVRLALFTLLAAILAGPHTVRVVDRLAVVAVVDVSGSVRAFAGEARGKAIDEVRASLAAATGRRGDQDLLGVVLFDGKSVVLSQPTLGDPVARPWNERMAEGTDIASAIRLARSIIPPDAAGRLLLVSDGNQTTGDAIAAAAEGAEFGGLPIDVVALDYVIDREVSVEQLDVPATAAAGAAVPVRVVLSASSDARGFLRLLMDDQPVDLSPGAAGDARPVELRAGINIERFDVPLDDRRVHRFRATFEPETAPDADGRVVAVADTIADNNVAEAFTITPGKGSILLVDGVGAGSPAGPGAALADALRAGGLRVTMLPPASMPTDMLAFEEHDVVILQNVAADEVPASTQLALASYVQDMGGGLVMTGGSASFGAGGWKGSPLEPLLPVRLDLPERLITSQVAIIFVLDNSGSMWRSVLGSTRTQQEIANDAAAIAIGTLERTDQLGVITFESEFDELVPLAPNLNAAETVSKVRQIVSGGGTNALPALRRAGERLRAAKAKHKHIVFLSDGRSEQASELPRLCEELAADDIKVTAIAIGDDADASTMNSMARRGGGAFHYVTDPSTLPQVFVKAVRVVRTPLIREEPFEPVILPSGSPLLSGITSLPTLGGLTLTQPRTDATVVNAVATPTGEPVLAHWQVGLGRVAAFTSDAHAWASSWIASPLYGQFWSQVVRGVARAPSRSDGLIASVRAGDGSLKVRLSSASLNASSLGAQASIHGPDPSLPAVQVTLVPTGPGELEAVVPVAASGSYVAIIKPSQEGRALAPLLTGASIDQGREHRFRSSNHALMKRVAEVSGGRERSFASLAKADLFDRGGVPPRIAMSPVWHLFAWAAMGVLLLDLANRRVAWDRWIGGFATRTVVASDPVLAAERLAMVRESVQTPESSVTLGEDDARRLAMQARDQRRAQKLAALTPPAEPASSEPGANEPSSLIAAKKRAAERFGE
jgi:Ca-activated chloride channel homolog